MSKFLKSFSVWMLAVLILGGAFFYFKFNLPVEESSLIIDFGAGSSRKFQGQVSPDMTILEALYSASVSGHFNFRYSIDKNGILQVAKIGEAVSLPGNSEWRFYLNGGPVNSGDIDKVKIKAGDRIEAKYE